MLQPQASTYLSGAVGHAQDGATHLIPGLMDDERCNMKGRQHNPGLDKGSPCKVKPEPLSRENLLDCLPHDISLSCAQPVNVVDPDVWRWGHHDRDLVRHCVLTVCGTNIRV